MPSASERIDHKPRTALAGFALWFTIFTRTTAAMMDEKMKRRTKGATGVAGDTGDSRVALNARVRVYPGTSAEVRGTVVDDFGDMVGHAVDIGDRIVEPRAKMGGRARHRRSGFRRQRPISRRVVLAVTVYTSSGDHLFRLRPRYRTIGCQPACRTPGRTLVNPPTDRSRQAVCRGPLIRLPDDATGVRWPSAAAQAARGALRGSCCAGLFA